MPIQRLHATWLFTASDGDANLNAELQRAAGGPALVFEQVTDGPGALVLGSEPGPDIEGVDGERKRAAFSLRSVDPRDADPAIDVSPFLLAVRLFVPEAGRDEVRRWLDEEHSAFQLSVPGTHWYLGYEEVGEDHSFLNLWGLADASVIDTAAWADARNTPWRTRLLSSFERQDRAVYRPVRPHTANDEVPQ